MGADAHGGIGNGFDQNDPTPDQNTEYANADPTELEGLNGHTECGSGNCGVTDGTTQRVNSVNMPTLELPREPNGGGGT